MDGRFPRSLGRRTYPASFYDAPWPDKSPWRLEYAIDFLAQSTQSFTSDTDYTIDGMTWSAVNTANAETNGFALTNGTGIVIQPKANTTFDHATKDAPYLQLLIDQVIDDYTYGDRIVVEVGVDIAGLSDTGQTYGFMLGSTQPADPDYDGCIANTYDSGTKLLTRRLWGNSTSEGTLSASEAPVLAIEWQPPAFVTYYLGEARWPRPGELQRAMYPASVGNFAPLSTPWPWSLTTVPCVCGPSSPQAAPPTRRPSRACAC